MASPSPRQLAALARGRLDAAGSAAVARQSLTYFKPGERVHFTGVKSSGVRSIEKEMFQMVRAVWAFDDALSYCDLMLRARSHECKIVGLLLLGRYHADFPDTLLPRTRGWLAAGRCANWAAVDTLAPTLLTPLIRRRPALARRLRAWLSDANTWVRRAAVVALVPLARKGEMLDHAYASVDRLLGDREDLIHKACGWLLREAGKTDPERLVAYLLDRGPRIPRTALRYAIERLPAPRRKQVLERTRAPQSGSGRRR